MTPTSRQISSLKLTLFALCLSPAILLLRDLQLDRLGANPIEALTRASGEWTLRFLLITLTVTPLRKYSGWHWILRFRRMLGLFAFAYGTMHLMTYVWLDQFFDWPAIVRDIYKRPFITVGFTALVLMTPLALSSNAFAIRKLGGRRWQALHRAIYPISLLGCLHFWWLVKKDITEPLIYTVIACALLGLRAWWREQERRKQLAGGYLQQQRFDGKVIRIVAK
ncbi:protein-methionine-sulfoxide reductase heme-binding subunit MsrQ [Zoogloea dura]|jgi:sulfoxide reductase heme-binding subunit YedZ|uniref:Protein-methionine-sulfoxide reductase heme-binding subunit MsrQ n=1 Tax=Zoogloea dura TaxID=2728840 RepID=A0A848G652_9RHOO|nr:protein-methionine-sulfoxide reductase heme-binding subunit MsrQ [Zoogloea dura]NML27728.1 sulfoxide reductase heme-binding subunit YedZ [Zoogloea dura]